MKSTDNFRETIKTYLDNKAASDVLFAKSYENEKKSLSECIQFILGEVMGSGNCAFTDDEVYGLAIHYYDEDNIKVKEAGTVKVVCPNSNVNLSDEDKELAKSLAIKEYQESLKDKMLHEATSRKPKAKSKETVTQLSLF